MKLERLAFASSLTLLGGLLVREVLNVRIRMRTMAIRYSILQSLEADESFVALHFNPFYDNRTLAKDLVSLEAYLESQDSSVRTMPRVPLEPVNKGDAYVNETDYSAYELTRRDIRSILDCFGDDAAIKYVLFIPEPYREDRRYFSYRIIPADVSKKKLPIKSKATMQAHSAMEVENESNAEHEDRVMMFANTASRTGIMYMDPSPPATAGFSNA